jgi:hypothetical protein
VKIYFSHTLGNQYQPEDFSHWTAPKWAIICGSNTDGKIAGPIYKSHGARVLNTAECGAVTVTIDAATVDAGGVDVQMFRPQIAGGK